MPTREFIARRFAITTAVALGLIGLHSPDAHADPATEPSLKPTHKASLYLASNGELDPIGFDRSRLPEGPST